ncbi:MAG: hypothetical protein M3024_15915 [Candidatus Dormibacteraeota bacterium]|nr:hypothetical protein [Candidatus Dormibacteraeota bacterium]
MRIAVILVALLPVAACSGQGTASPSPRPSAKASPTADPAAQLAAWKACGSDVVPPANVLALPPLPAQVDLSRTNGSPPQAEARLWFQAYLREQNIEAWAVDSNREGVLLGGCLGSPRAAQQLFDPEIGTMRMAKSLGGHLRGDPDATTVGVALTPAPAGAQDFVKALSGEQPAFAVVVTEQGPLAVDVVDPSGKVIKKLGQTAAGVTFQGATFGRFRTDQIGPIWYQLASASCGSTWLAGTC